MGQALCPGAVPSPGRGLRRGRLAADPGADLSCNINSVVSCGAVGSSWQAHLFGFPNAFLGLVAEPVVITIAYRPAATAYSAWAPSMA
ncbi:vitamin K epoxide reductase family protein [Nonomuraea basaltis]|uniref:vitamin K epoxide reductase family protein n=1 Tax=Nonomuraea basaltis TaxID=2495887 RepID=UPI001F0D50EB|nr:vitamin K epoxide reductase family protein [Nonomuraea basaltis]